LTRRQIGRADLTFLGVTLALLGYFLPWLPHPAAGLRLIGLEMGEWTKFLPQMRSGELGISPDTFYLPPITLALILALVTAHWPNGRWQSWLARLLAVGFGLLALPAWEVMRDEPPANWRARLFLVGLVAVVAFTIGLAQRAPRRLIGGVIAVIAIAGALVPFWAYLVVRPVIAQLLGAELGIGPGLWLSLVGHLLVAAMALERKKKTATGAVLSIS
jgi:hypothetical protein